MPGTGFAAELDQHYQAQISGQSFFRISHYLTVIRHPERNKRRMVDAISRRGRALFSKTREVRHAARQDDMEKLMTAVELSERQLLGLGARRLADEAEDRSEALTFLSWLQSGIWQKAPALWAPLDKAVPNGRITFFKNHLESRSPGGDQDKLGAVFAVNAYPEKPNTAMFNELLGEEVEFTLTQSFSPMDRIAAGVMIEDAVSSMEDAGDEAETLIRDLEHARDAVASRRMTMGRHHLTVSVLAPTMPELRAAVSRVNTALANTGMRVRREDVALELSWWAQLPGNFAYQSRSKNRYVSSRNFADFGSPHNWDAGSRDNLRWGGPLAVFRTGGGTPFWFSFHREGSSDAEGPGTTALFGATGEGKTALVNFLLSCSTRLPEPPQIVVFDMNRACEPFIRALGGTYLSLQPGQNLGFNPFAIATDEIGIAWLEGFIKRLTDVEKLTPEQEARIAAGLRRLAEGDPDLRSFGDFIGTLRSVDDGDAPVQLLDVLAKWHGGGARSWLFDNDRDSFEIDQQVTAFDLTALLKDSDIRMPLLDYLFFRLERKLESGKPMIIVLEEAWSVVDDPRFAKRIDDWIRTIRMRNGIIVFSTQNASDASKAAISDTLIQSTENRIFFPNPQANEDTYCGKFRLSKDELACVRGMTPKCRSILFKSSRDSILLNTRLDADPGTLKVLSGTAKSVQEMDRLLATYGEDGWLEPFMNPDHSHLKEISA